MIFELHQCVGSRLRRLSRQADHYFRECLSEYDISENQMTLLFALHTFGEIEQGMLGKELVLDKSTVSRNVKLLEKKGYLSKSADYHPKISLSPAGTSLALELIPLWQETMQVLYQKLGKEGLELIGELESKLL